MELFILRELGQLRIAGVHGSHGRIHRVVVAPVPDLRRWKQLVVVSQAAREIAPYRGIVGLEQCDACRRLGSDQELAGGDRRRHDVIAEFGPLEPSGLVPRAQAVGGSNDRRRQCRIRIRSTTLQIARADIRGLRSGLVHLRQQRLIDGKRRQPGPQFRQLLHGLAPRLDLIRFGHAGAVERLPQRDAHRGSRAQAQGCTHRRNVDAGG